MKNALLAALVILFAVGCEKEGHDERGTGPSPSCGGNDCLARPVKRPTLIPTPRTTASPTVSPAAPATPTPISTGALAPDLSRIRIRILPAERGTEVDCDAVKSKRTKRLHVVAACLEGWTGPVDGLVAVGPDGARSKILSRTREALPLAPRPRLKDGLVQAFASLEVEDHAVLPDAGFATTHAVQRLQSDLLFGRSGPFVHLVGAEGELVSTPGFYGPATPRTETSQDTCGAAGDSSACSIRESILLLPKSHRRIGALISVRSHDEELALGFLSAPLFEARLAEEHGLSSLPWIVSAPDVP